MRKIIFRGKRIDTDEWIEGVPIVWDDGRVDICVPQNGDGVHLSQHVHIKQFQVDPATVGQWTGLKDSAGKDIFEGDILSLVIRLGDGRGNAVFTTFTVTITFENGGFWFSGDGYSDTNWHFYDPKDRTIIGNVHDQQQGGE